LTKLIKNAFLIVIIAIAIVGSSAFYGCKKDTVETSQKELSIKKTGSTQIVDINTVIMVGTVEYPVVGTAVVNNHNRTIYNVNVEWTIQLTGTDVSTNALNAVLKPEYEGVTDPIVPVMDNYIITVTNPNMITAESLHSLWVRIVGICNSSVTVGYPFVLPETMRPYQYAVYVDDILRAFNYMQTVFDNYVEGEEWGYFMLSYSFNTAGSRIHYGFITESSIYYNLDIDAPFVFIGDTDNPFIIIDDDGDDNNDDNDNNLMYGCHVRTFSDKNKAVAWENKKLDKDREHLDYRIGMNVNKNGKKTWTVVIFRTP
jgi:hypothetical protein